MSESCQVVAQISNLLYRRIPFGRRAERSETLVLAKVRGLEIRDTAGWNPALRAFSPGQIEAFPEAISRATSKRKDTALWLATTV